MNKNLCTVRIKKLYSKTKFRSVYTIERSWWKLSNSILGSVERRCINELNYWTRRLVRTIFYCMGSAKNWVNRNGFLNARNVYLRNNLSTNRFHFTLAPPLLPLFYIIRPRSLIVREGGTREYRRQIVTVSQRDECPETLYVIQNATWRERSGSGLIKKTTLYRNFKLLIKTRQSTELLSSTVGTPRPVQ